MTRNPAGRPRVPIRDGKTHRVYRDAGHVEGGMPELKEQRNLRGVERSLEEVAREYTRRTGERIGPSMVQKIERQALRKLAARLAGARER